MDANGFVPIQNYTTLKRLRGHLLQVISFVPLQNYTTLKQIVDGYVNEMCFVPLQNYTTLKPQIFKKNGLRTICVIL